MKKQISLCLALALAFSLAACGGAETADAGEPSAPAASDAAAGDTAGDAGTAADTAQNEEPADTAPAGPVYGATLEEQVVLENESIKLTATGMHMGTARRGKMLAYRSGDSVGMTNAFRETEYLYLDFAVENTSDKSYEVFLRDITVDGCAGFGQQSLQTEEEGFNQTVTFAAGETAQASVPLTSESLADYDIKTISDIVFTVYLYDRENSETLYDSEPCTLTTSAYGEYTHTFTPEGEVLYDEGGITVVLGQCAFDDGAFASSLLSSSPGGSDVDRCYFLPIFISNQSEDAIEFSLSGTTDNQAIFQAGTCGFWNVYIDENRDTLCDENVDTFELPLSIEIGRITKEEDGGYSSPESIAAVNDITVTFDDSAAKAYWDALPSSAEEAEAQFEANS